MPNGKHGHPYLRAGRAWTMWDLVAVLGIPAVLVLVVSIYKDA